MPRDIADLVLYRPDQTAGPDWADHGTGIRPPHDSCHDQGMAAPGFAGENAIAACSVPGCAYRYANCSRMSSFVSHAGFLHVGESKTKLLF